MDKVCRLCLRKDTGIISIFSGGEDTPLSNRILVCTSLEVNKNDKLPQMVCTRCRLQLEEFYLFRKSCLASDRRLRRHKQRLNQGKMSDLYAPYNDEDDEGMEQLRTTQITERNWRDALEQTIRNEIEVYKKQLKGTCKNELRAEMEQQIKSELQDEMYYDVKEQCQLAVMDDLFCELEKTYVFKRNALVRGQHIEVEYSGSITPEIQGDSIMRQNVARNDRNLNKNDYVNYVDLIVNEAGEICVGHLKDDILEVSNEDVSLSSQTSTTASTNVGSEAMPMVEINMDGNGIEQLRDDKFTSTILKRLSNTTETTNKRKSKIKRVNFADKLIANQFYELLCPKHEHYTRIKDLPIGAIRACSHCKLKGATDKYLRRNPAKITKV